MGVVRVSEKHEILAGPSVLTKCAQEHVIPQLDSVQQEEGKFWCGRCTYESLIDLGAEVWVNEDSILDRVALDDTVDCGSHGDAI